MSDQERNQPLHAAGGLPLSVLLAAPDLLAACQAVLGELHLLADGLAASNEPDDQLLAQGWLRHVRRIAAAIEKARGQAPARATLLEVDAPLFSQQLNLLHPLLESDKEYRDTLWDGLMEMLTDVEAALADAGQVTLVAAAANDPQAAAVRHDQRGEPDDD